MTMLMSWPLILAQAEEAANSGGNTATDWADLAQYGVLGLVVLGMVWGKIVPGYIYERRFVEYESEKAENRRLEETIKEKVIPALVKSTDVMQEVLDMLNDLNMPQPPPPARKRTVVK